MKNSNFITQMFTFYFWIGLASFVIGLISGAITFFNPDGQCLQISLIEFFFMVAGGLILMVVSVIKLINNESNGN